MTDQFNFLEKLDSQEALNWVKKENALTTEQFTKNKIFNKTFNELKSVLFDSEALPHIYKRKGYVYNFWQDEKNIIGVWRRTTLDKYKEDIIDWEILIDFDELSQNENHQWFFGGPDFLHNNEQYCLVFLSDQGSDSVQIREFDLEEKKFIENGFFIDTAKTNTCWINQNEIYVMSDFGEGSLTLSGYPRLIKKWKRGTPLDQAETVFEIDHHDMSAVVYLDQSSHSSNYIFMRVKRFYENEFFLNEQQLKIDIPANSNFVIHNQIMFLELKSDWDLSVDYTAGSLMMIDFNAFMQGDRNFKIITQSKNEKILNGFALTRDFLILNIMKDVNNFLEIYDIRNDVKFMDAIYAEQKFSDISIYSLEHDSNEILVMAQSFTAPAIQYLIDLDSMQRTQLKFRKHHIKPEDFRVEQHFAESKDGTKIPYFQISQKNHDSITRPVLIEGYGGYEISLLPRFLEKEITSWISKGAVYVVANIRGGGEYGSHWHQQALKQNRYRSYEDFAAVAHDLAQRGVTIPEQTAAIGGSNGGLLMGNMLTKYPELFGAIVCEVPLLDMLHYTEFGAGHSWIAEYGDPSDPKEAEFLRKFSPYHLLDNQIGSSKKYPAVLFYTTSSDDRVTPFHARKMAAKMKDMNIDDVYFYEQIDGGHNISANKELSAFHSALVSTFLIQMLKFER